MRITLHAHCQYSEGVCDTVEGREVRGDRNQPDRCAVVISNIPGHRDSTPVWLVPLTRHFPPFHCVSQTHIRTHTSRARAHDASRPLPVHHSCLTATHPSLSFLTSTSSHTQAALARMTLHDHFQCMVTAEDELDTISQRLLTVSGVGWGVVMGCVWGFGRGDYDRCRARRATFLFMLFLFMNNYLLSVLYKNRCCCCCRAGLHQAGAGSKLLRLL